jgi:hypothetical protein
MDRVNCPIILFNFFMKISSKCIFINLEENITILGGSIQMKLIFQATIYQGKDNKCIVDFEIMDFEDILYWGKPIDLSFSKLSSNLNELGVEINDLIDEQFDLLITDELRNKLLTPFVNNYILESFNY